MSGLDVRVVALLALLIRFSCIGAIEPCFPPLGPPPKAFPPCQVVAGENHATGPNSTTISFGFSRPYCMSSCVVEAYEHGSKVKLLPPASGVVKPPYMALSPYKNDPEPLDKDPNWCYTTSTRVVYRSMEFNSKGLIPGRKYDFSIYCRNDNATIGPEVVTPRVNMTLTANKGDICTYLGPVTNIRKVSSVAKGSKINMTITWDSPKGVPSNCISGYLFMWRESKKPSVEFLSGQAVDTNKFTHEFEAGKSYDFKVTPTHDNGTPWSDFGPDTYTAAPVKA